ncbi:AAA family ATPase [PVC group bacterium]|nr:AAA family ATPase [PVC group bacterium]
MYLEYWGLNQHPFNNVPDPEMYFSMHQSVEESVAEILFAIEEGDECLAVITGKVGVGKTMSLRIVLDTLDHDKYRIAFVINPDLSFTQLLREIIGQLEDQECEERRKDKLLERFNKILFATNDEGKRVLIFIDEGNVIKPANLESLRLLTNMQEDKQNLFTMILAGQPELARRLEDPRRANLFQRIGVYCRMTGMTSCENMRDYIEHRLERAGLKQRVFSDEAYDVLWEHSEDGVPRLVNKLCKLSMKAGETNNLTQITPEVVQAVAARFIRSKDIKQSTKKKSSVSSRSSVKIEDQNAEEIASQLATDELRHIQDELKDPYEAWVLKRRQILEQIQSGDITAKQIKVSQPEKVT